MNTVRDFAFITLVAGLGACTSLPEALTTNDLAGRTGPDWRPGAANQPPITQPLTRDEALARAITFNTRFQIEAERALEQLSGAGIVAPGWRPQAYAGATTTRRSNEEASLGMRVGDDPAERPDDFFTGVDRGRTLGRLVLTWNVIDAALGSLNRKAGLLSAYRADEQVRISCGGLIADVERAFWRTVAWQKAAAKADWLENRIAYGLELSRNRMQAAPDTAFAELSYQRELIDISRWYASMYRGLSSAPAELSELMNAPFDAVSVDVSPDAPSAGTLPESREDLVLLAFSQRPELRQALYDEALATNQMQRELRSLLPGVSLFLRADSDSNSFLLNNTFLTAGADVSLNLLALTEWSGRKRSGEAGIARARLNTETIATAVAAQVAIADEELRLLGAERDLAWQAVNVQAELTQRMRADVEAGRQPETYLVKEELLRELSVLREDIARAEQMASRARLVRSVGLAPACGAGDSLETSRQIIVTWNGSLSGR